MKAFLVFPYAEPTAEQEEFRELASVAGYEVVAERTIRLREVHPATFLGKGKVQEIAAEIRERAAEVALLDAELSAVQHRNLEDAWRVPLLDRVMLILEIFARHAHSREGKLQVELATLQYQLPRLHHRGTEFSRLGGLPGTRGPGEPIAEKRRRALERRLRELRAALDRQEEIRRRRRTRRRRGGLPLVALAGYTNAGKTTLLNALTRSGQPVRDQVFTTLDAVTRRWYLPEWPGYVLLTDTVGFVRRLPHHLVEAFRATLEEITEADLVLLVVDVARDDWEETVDAALKVLETLEARNPRIVVLNKADRLPRSELERRQRKLRLWLREPVLAVSALRQQNLQALRTLVISRLKEGRSSIITLR